MIDTVYIMRGLPGSGKSTEAAEIASHRANAGPAVICSTDDFFVVDGVYTWDPTKLGLFHRKNFEKFQKALRDEVPTVIVDNTNIHRSHYKNYVATAKAAGYDVVCVVAQQISPQEAAKRNTHNVPLETLVRMHRSFNPTADEDDFDRVLYIR